MTVIYWPDYAIHSHAPEGNYIGPIFQLLPTPLPFDAISEGDPLKLSGSYLVPKN